MKRKRLRHVDGLVMVLLWLSVGMVLTGGKRVLFIGDSITDGGWGNSGGSAKCSKERNHGDMNHIYGHSYMMLCAAHYQGECPDSDYVFFNRGISGNTLYDMAASWQEDALDLQPDVVSILIGTNDIHRFLEKKDADGEVSFDYERWEMCYRRLVEELKVWNPKVKVVLGAPFVAKEGWVGETPTYELRAEMVKKLAVIVKKMSEDVGAVYLPYDEMFAELVKTEPRKSYWIWDGIHPTPAGHQKMADLWISTVKL